MKNLPNILTLSRIALLPAIIWLIYIDYSWIALALYAVTALSDFLDGYLARKMNIVSGFGTFLDPIADKIFVAALLLAFADIGRIEGLWIIPAVLILMREFLVSGLREFLGPKNIQLPVSKLAKWKTTIQMVAVGLLIPHHEFLIILGQWGLLIAAILTVITGWQYMKAGLKHIPS